MSVINTESHDNQSELQNGDNSENQNNTLKSHHQDPLICERPVNSTLNVELEEL